jgi:hypothetical protein
MGKITVDKKLDVTVRITGDSEKEVDENLRIAHDQLMYALPNCIVRLKDCTPLEERVEHLEDIIASMLNLAKSEQQIVFCKREGTD